jgi:hypothetical protein
MRIIILIFLLTCSIPVYAENVCDPKDPVSDFACNSTATFVICKLKVELGLLKNSPVAETFACIDEYKQPMRSGFEKAKGELKRNKEAMSALKELYAYWLTSMDALSTDSEERQIDYKRRTQERAEGLKQRSNKLKIEANVSN